MKHATIWIPVLLLSALPATAQVKADVALRAAMERETVQGDLKGAIEQYRKIVASYAANHSVAAQALFHMAQCFEKLGDRQARQTYDRLLHDYPDQTEVAAAVRARIAGLGGANAGITTIRRLPVADGLDSGWCVSPDGRFAAFADGPEDESDLALMDLSSGQKRRLTHRATKSAGAEECYFSPDGKQVAFDWSSMQDGDELRVINVDGSGERVVFKHPSLGVQDWTGETIVVVLDPGPRRTQPTKLALISVRDGSSRILKTVEAAIPLAKASPDGHWLAVTGFAGTLNRQHDILLISTSDGSETYLSPDAGSNRVVGWTPGGNSLLFLTDKDTSTDLYAWPVKAGKAAGSPVLVRRNIGSIFAARVIGNGALYYNASRSDAVDVFLAPLDPDTGRVGPPSLATRNHIGSNSRPVWSPDGNTLAYHTGMPFPTPGSSPIPLGPGAMAFLNVATGAVKELDLAPFFFGLTQWRPDGAAMLLQATSGEARQGIYLLNPASKEITAVVTREGVGDLLQGPLWLPDGKSILYTSGNTILKRVLGTGQSAELYRAKEQLVTVSLALSADGSRLAFLEGTALMVMPAGGGEARGIVRLPASESFSHIHGIAWMPNGREILFSKTTGGSGRHLPVSLWRVPADGGEPVDTGLTFDDLNLWTKNRRDLRIESLSVHPAGRRIAFSLGPLAMEQAWVLEGLPDPK